MKKLLIIIGIITLLIYAGLSGCTDKTVNTEKNNKMFIGTWKGDFIEPNLSYYPNIRHVTKLIFSDDAVNMTIGLEISITHLVNSSIDGTYKTEGDKLFLTFPRGVALSYTYRFEDGYLYLDNSKFTKE